VAAVVSTEICSATFFSDDAPDLVVSNAIFADGSAAALLSTRGRGAVIIDAASRVAPEWRDTLRFRTDGGHLRNVLGRNVPAQSAKATEGILQTLLKRQNLKRGDIGRWALHAGGAKVLEALEKEIGLAPEALAANRAVLRRFGNISSPTVLFVLAESLRRRPARPGEWGFMASFGAGFSAHGALLHF